MSAGPDLTNEDDPRVAQLRMRLDDFYSTARGYEAFDEPVPKPQFWGPIVDEVRRCVQRTGRCRILEFGAGRTSFGEYLGDLRARVEFHVQDVTTQNTEFLAGVADSVHIGDISLLSGPYDVIFSTFVWEHITNPRATLGHLLRALSPEGSLFLVSPRYDLPFYLSPSARNRPRAQRILLGLRVMAHRVRSLLGGKPAFLIDTAPAVLSQPWFRDSDAIHWVSLLDLRRALPPGTTVTSLKVPAHSLRYWIYSVALVLFVRITRTGFSRPEPDAEDAPAPSSGAHPGP